VATQVIQTAAHLPEKHRCRNELRSRGFNSVAGRSKTTVSIQAVPDTLTLDADLKCKVVGLSAEDVDRVIDRWQAMLARRASGEAPLSVRPRGT
jgi:hypothetical protein